MGVRNPKGRVKIGVLNSTRTKDQGNKCTKVWYSRVSYFNRNKHIIRKRCYRTCTCQSRKRRILQHHFCGAKEARRASDNLKFETSKSVSCASTFQNGDAVFNYESIKKRGLCYLPGSDRCLFSHSNSHRFPEISTIPISRPELPVSSDAVWTSFSSKGFHKNIGSSCSTFKENGNPSFHVPRRLVAGQCRQNNSHKSEELCFTAGSRTGIVSELGKIVSSAVPTYRVSGGTFQSSRRQCDTHGNQISEYPRHCAVSIYKSTYSSNRDSQIIGTDGFVHLSGSAGKVTHAPYTVIPTSIVETEDSSSYSYDCDSSNSTSAPTMVDEARKFLQRNALTGPSKSTNIDNRCIRTRLGSTYRELGDSRDLASSISAETHQLARTEGCTISSSRSSIFDKGESHPYTIRQHNSDKLYQQARGDTFTRTVLSNLGVVPVVHSVQNHNTCCSHSREEEFSGRCTFSGESSKNDGMVTQQHCGKFVVSTNGNPMHRLVCNCRKQEVTSLLFSVSGHESNSSRCFNNQLERDVCLCISTPNSCTQSSAQTKGRDKCCTSHCSNVAQAVVVPSDIRSSDRYTSQVTTVARPSVSKSQSEFSSKSRDSQSCSMETVKLRHKSKGFSEEIAEIMANARKTSTQTVYDARLRIYNGWCKEQGVNPITTSIPELAEFFMYLFNVRKCKPQTIAGYKSAIAIIHQNGSSIGINSELLSLLKGLFNKYPSTRQLTPNWNLPLVLLALTKHPFEPLESADLKFLTLKTVFLVAIASASRVSEIHSLSLDDGHFRLERKGIKMLPNMEFLAKTQTMNRPWEPIYIPAFDSYATDSEDLKLCPCRALKIYINRTKSIRKSNRLFVTYQQNNHKEASKDSIARWIVSMVRFAYDNAESETLKIVRAHDTRRLSTSWALFCGASANDILRAAHWASETTFTSFYLKDVPDHQSIFAKTAILDSSKRGKQK